MTLESAEKYYRMLAALLCARAGGTLQVPVEELRQLKTHGEPKVQVAVREGIMFFRVEYEDSHG